ncbi:ABC transporter ATP-binding protein [Iamia sp. SCSIO 61187]|uniref:ABC transporter ATP-binding protein n=1 Tax=Iamia sp. SCSIO 61187 TaxID=2722752 RepID=UPI001C627F58|nr:ABC transporter ATP-binding protein [Iamia sp. SCSIO 61187]QYG94547.1 ABC transporter ATP-binding protein [Iamia sp. SCSIO 61187]
MTGPGPTPPMVAVDGCTRWFGDVVAVSEVSFSLGPGVTALLGPNGAGKSTLLRLLCGLVAPARGTVRILGRDPRRDVAVHRHLGLVPQQETVFDRLTAFELVELCAGLRGVEDAKVAATWALDAVELDGRDPRPLPTYSRGMRQRVKVAQAIVHRPSVIVLDEPLTGLDPRQRRHMTDLFHSLGDQGCCVIVSSHVLEEVERFGSDVLVIVQGRLAAEGDFRAIRDLMDDRPHRIRLRTDHPQEVAGRLLAARTIVGLDVVDVDTVIVETDRVHELRATVAAVARAADARLWEVVPLDDDLDSVFRYLVGR